MWIERKDGGQIINLDRVYHVYTQSGTHPCLVFNQGNNHKSWYFENEEEMERTYEKIKKILKAKELDEIDLVELGL